METKFRPVPLTILDFLGILLPGFIWLVLLATTFEVFRVPDRAATSPVAAWLSMVEAMRGWDSWLAPLTVILISLLLGYVIKPWAMDITNIIARPLFFFSQHRQLRLRELTFPFKPIYEQRAIYPKLIELLREKLGPNPEELPGTAPFSVAKRYLRLTAPTLWEESERMEAEVRMTGALFLASLYSFALSLLTYILKADVFQAGELRFVKWWLAFSALAAIILGRSVNLLRVREVGYTYLNALIALRCVKEIPPTRAEGDDDD